MTNTELGRKINHARYLLQLVCRRGPDADDADYEQLGRVVREIMAEARSVLSESDAARVAADLWDAPGAERKEPAA